MFGRRLIKGSMFDFCWHNNTWTRACSRLEGVTCSLACLAACGGGAFSPEPDFFLQQGAHLPFYIVPCNSGAQAKITALESELESAKKRLSEARRELAENRRDAKARLASLFCIKALVLCCARH